MHRPTRRHSAVATGLAGGGARTSNSYCSTYGGIVNATGGFQAAGIGGGDHSDGADLAIHGGIVTAIGDNGNANGYGIGGTPGTHGAPGTCVIRSGNVNASSMHPSPMNAPAGGAQVYLTPPTPSTGTLPPTPPPASSASPWNCRVGDGREVLTSDSRQIDRASPERA